MWHARMLVLSLIMTAQKHLVMPLTVCDRAPGDSADAEPTGDALTPRTGWVQVFRLGGFR